MRPMPEHVASFLGLGPEVPEVLQGGPEHVPLGPPQSPQEPNLQQHHNSALGVWGTVSLRPWVLLAMTLEWAQLVQEGPVSNPGMCWCPVLAPHTYSLTQQCSRKSPLLGP